LLVLVVALIFGINPGDLTNMTGIVPQNSDLSAGEVSDLVTECQTGADANSRQDCAVVGYVNSIQAYWADEFASHNAQYTPATTVLFSGSTQAACGYASGATGPFYCPDDQSIYLDLSFLDDLLSRFGAKGGPFAEAYILAHEYGHHVQNQLGLLNTSSYSRDRGPQSMTVYTELQADCLAGIWISHAVETGYLSQLTEEEVRQSLDAAASVGDDRVQRQTQGYVSPESWTHGSSEQRFAALLDGIQSGDINTCETPGWNE
jgi:predicted metalloprotease